jgi:hypothetical protein
MPLMVAGANGRENGNKKEESPQGTKLEEVEQTIFVVALIMKPINRN